MSTGVARGLFSGKRFTLILLGLLLNSVILSTGFTFFLSFRNFSSDYFGGADDVAVIYNPAAATVYTGSVPAYLTDHIKSISGVIGTSSEILTPAMTLGGDEVTVRGISSGFFGIQALKKVVGDVSVLKSGGCLMGVRAYQRLGLSLGEHVTFRSVLRDVLLECNVTGVFSSGSPLDDEVIMPISEARFLSGVGSGDVTLIRVKLDLGVINDSDLRNILRRNYTATVELNTTNSSNWSTNIDVKTIEGAHVTTVNVDVPSITTVKLPYGDYIFDVGGQSKEVVLNTNSSIKFDLTGKLNRVTLHIVDSITGESVNNAEIMVNGGTSQNIRGVTDSKGECVLYLKDGQYNVTVDYDGQYAERTIKAGEADEVVIGLGPSNLYVVFDDQGTRLPVSGAFVSVTGNGAKYQNITGESGTASFRLNPDEYNVSLTLGAFNLWRTIDLNEDTVFVLLRGAVLKQSSLGVQVLWLNGTEVPGAAIELKGDYVTWAGSTGGLGTVFFTGLPAGNYSLSAESQGFVKTVSVNLLKDRNVSLGLPTPASFRQDQLSTPWVRYLPQELAVNLSGRVYSDSMKVLVNLVEATMLVLAGVFTLSTTLNSVDIIRNSMNENGRSLGLIRSIGATWRDAAMLLGGGIVTSSILVGFFGYMIGYLIIWLTAKSGVLLLAGYTIQPRFSLILLIGCLTVCPLVSAFAVFSSLNNMKRVSAMTLLKGLRKSEVLHFPGQLLYPLMSFFIPLILRAVPEVLTWPLPIGWDTVSSYIPVWGGLREGFESQLTEIIRQRPFFWVIGMLPYPLGGGAPFKLFPVLLHGLLGLSVFYYGLEYFGSRKKALAVSLLSTLYFVSLRVSWDLQANEMGLILVFLSLTLLTRGLETWTKTVMALSSVLATTLTHEGASILLFVSSMPILVRSLRSRDSNRSIKILVALIIPFSYFVYHIITINYPLFSNPMNNFQYPSSTYTELTMSVLTFYLYCTALLLPFILVGRKSQFYYPMLVWLVANSLAALSPIISPTYAFNNWERWTYMTALPLSFFTVEGLDWLSGFKVMLKRVNPRVIGLHLPIGLAYLTLIAVISVSFLSMPPAVNQPFQRVFGEDSSWLVRTVPSTMLMSTVTPSDAANAVQLIEWLNTNVTGKAVLMVDEEFRGYAWLFCDSDKIAIKDLGSPYYVDSLYSDKVAAAGRDLTNQGFHVFFLGRPLNINGFDVLQRSSFIRLYSVN